MKIHKEEAAKIRNLIKDYPATALDRNLVIYELNPVHESVSKIIIMHDDKSALPFGVVISASKNPSHNELNLQPGDVIQYNEGSHVQLGMTNGCQLISIYNIDAKVIMNKKYYQMEVYDAIKLPVKGKTKKKVTKKKK